MVNVKNLKFYETSMLDEEEERVLLFVEYLASNTQVELKEDTIF